jgi:hypothetical protein
MLHLWSNRLRLRSHGQLIASVVSHNRKHILVLFLILDVRSVKEFFVGVGLARIVVLTKRERGRAGQGGEGQPRSSKGIPEIVSFCYQLTHSRRGSIVALHSVSSNSPPSCF